MFDVSSGEMLLVFLIGLIVLGPTRLPKALGEGLKASRTLKSMVSNAKQEMKQQLEIHELENKIKLTNEQRIKNINGLSDDLQSYLKHKSKDE